MTWNTALFLIAMLMFGTSSTQNLTAQPQVDRGREVYSEYCQRCHGTQGQGPSNIRTKNVWASPVDSLVKVIAYGARGHMTMRNGTRRSMVASPYNDADIAQVSMYAMKLIGSRDVTVTEQDVQRVREQHAKNVRQKFRGTR